eukprot:11137596-Alexandrium_andersonii.AAC.1
MSASLVGSEMCIRDRTADQGKAPRSAASGLLHISGPATHGPCRMGEGEACLLYTSDAADDM